MPDSHESPGLWRRLRSLVGAAEPPASVPPLFRLRPVPPPEPKGPGLPPLESLLTEPPPITQAMLRSLDPPAPPMETDDDAENDGLPALRPLFMPPPPMPRAPPASAAPPVGVPLLSLIADEHPILLPPPPLAAEATGMLPAGTPGRLLGPAMLSLADDGTVEVTEATQAETGAPGELAMVLRHPAGLTGAALIETVLALFTLQRGFFAHLRPARIYVGAQDWATTASATMAPQLLAVLFPRASVIGAFTGTIAEPKVLLVDGGLRNAATDTLIGGMMPHIVRHAAEARHRIFAAFGLPDAAEPPRAPGRRPQALFLHAAPPRALADAARERLLALLQRAGYNVTVADMTGLPWRRQVRVACGADLIVGAHGPAMSAVLWGHKDARVLEFFPEGARRYDGQLLAEAAGLGYLGLEGVAERGFVIRARERWGPPAGETNRLVFALPWSMLEQALAQRPPSPPA
jgi:hypothetical protein